MTIFLINLHLGIKKDLIEIEMSLSFRSLLEKISVLSNLEVLVMRTRVTCQFMNFVLIIIIKSLSLTLRVFEVHNPDHFQVKNEVKSKVHFHIIIS